MELKNKSANPSSTNVLLTCNPWKTHSSATPLLTFSNEQEIQIIDYIKLHLDVFFEGSKISIQQKFKNFFRDTIEKNDLATAINSNTDICAMVQQIPNL